MGPYESLDESLGGRDRQMPFQNNKNTFALPVDFSVDTARDLL